MLQALGLIEVTGYLGAITAADAALKAANVHLLKSEKIRGGITTIELVGDVAAVSAAVEAGTVVAENLGSLRSSHVIPRLDAAVQALLIEDKSKETAEQPPEEVKDQPATSKGEPSVASEETMEVLEDQKQPKPSQKKTTKKSKKK